MKVLGIVASQRRLGNSEILTKEALMGAEEQGAEVEIVRLTDYHILPCDGLAPCVFSEERCNLNDDFNLVLDKIYDCDGLILGSPCYILEAPAIVKQLIDRMFSVAWRSRARGKPAAIIMPYATRGWTPYAFLQPNILLQFLGMDVIDRALIFIQGMSEAVINERALKKAHEIGGEVAAAIKTGDHTYRGEPGLCPICHDRNIHILKDNETVECGTCAIRGRLVMEGGKISVHFPEEEIKRHRWAEDNLYRHWTYHIKPSRDYFQKVMPLQKEGRVKYREYLHIERDSSTVI